MLVLVVLDAGSPGIATLPALSAVSTVTVPLAFLMTTRPPGGALISTSVVCAIATPNVNEVAIAAAIRVRLKGVVMA